MSGLGAALACYRSSDLTAGTVQLRDLSLSYPPLILLDEHFAGVDQVTQEHLLESIERWRDEYRSLRWEEMCRYRSLDTAYTLALHKVG